MQTKKNNFHGYNKFSGVLLATYGIPHAIVWDKYTHFIAYEFKEYCKMFTIKHITNLTHYSRSNGKAERAVGNFKRALKRPSNEIVSEKAQKTLLRVYLITPNPNTPADMSPA